MVRLKLKLTTINILIGQLFQFLYGTIKIHEYCHSQYQAFLFQFLYGTIKIREAYLNNSAAAAFQFLYGTIKIAMQGWLSS